MVKRYMSISCFCICDARKGPEFRSSPSLSDVEEEFPSCRQFIYIFLVFSGKKKENYLSDCTRSLLQHMGSLVALRRVSAACGV